MSLWGAVHTFLAHRGRGLNRAVRPWRRPGAGGHRRCRSTPRRPRRCERRSSGTRFRARARRGRASSVFCGSPPWLRVAGELHGLALRVFAQPDEPGRVAVLRHVHAALQGGALVDVDGCVEGVAAVLAARQAQRPASRSARCTRRPRPRDAHRTDRRAVERAARHLPAVCVHGLGRIPLADAQVRWREMSRISSLVRSR